MQQKNKWVTTLSYLAMTALEILLLNKLNLFDSFTKFRDFTAMILFPAISGNLLYHYLSRRYGLLIVDSESRTGTVDKGDCVIYEEYTGQVIPNEVIAVFKSSGILKS